MSKRQPHKRYHLIADDLYSDPNVREGTIMGFKCFRLKSEFLGMVHHQTGELVVKLPQNRVAELIDQGIGQSFGPGSKVFKEWISIPKYNKRKWLKLIDEAKAFVAK